MKTLRLLLAIGALTLAGCRSHSSSPSQGPDLSGRNVLLVTLDTTRADHIGCYGYAPASTPHLDALAKNGVVFENAYTQAPLTCPAHCSLLTGRYPQEHGVLDNGRESLPQGIPTLGERFKAAGYRTAAFVSAYILGSRFGVNRGFDTYDDLGDAESEEDPSHLERRGDVTTDHALQWLGSDSRKPFFLWVHYYDAHAPYEPPEPFKSANKLPYDGELAFVDSQFGRLIAALKTAGLLDRTLIIVVGDHGEAFGEHGEQGHTTFVHEENLHIPIIFSSPGKIQAGRCPSLVELVDIFPTVSEVLRWSAPAGLLSRSLAPSLSGGEIPPRDVYSESVYAFDAWGLTEQRSLTTPNWKFISSAKPVLYDRSADRGEMKNVILQHSDVAKTLDGELLERYESMHPLSAAQSGMTAAARSAVQSLGYVSARPSTAPTYRTKGLGEIADVIDIIERRMSAYQWMKEGKLDDAMAYYELLVKRLPQAATAHNLLARCYLRAGRPDDAFKEFAESFRLDPRSADALIEMADICLKAGKNAEAIAHYRAATTIEPNDSRTFAKLGHALVQANQADDAARAFEQAIALHTRLPEVFADLGSIRSQQGRADEAIAHLQHALSIKPDMPLAHFNLGTAYVTSNRLPQAIEEFRAAIRLDPRDGGALNGLAVALIQSGRVDEAKKTFQQAAEIPASAPSALMNLARLAEQEGNDAEAVKSYERALALHPPDLSAVELLVYHHLQHGRTREAVELLRQYLSTQPENPVWLTLLADILSTSRDDSIRNAVEALALANRALKGAPNRPVQVLNALAAAKAESTEFSDAIRLQQESLATAESNRAPAQFLENMRARLAAYQSQKPFRSENY